MAEQAHKFGARIRELRNQRSWKQKDLVAAMEKLGDQSLNTNQLSRYENGGAMPGEQRQEWFAEALETSVADLIAGPPAERKPPGSPLEALSSQNGAQLDRIEERLADLAARVENLHAFLEEQWMLLAEEEAGEKPEAPPAQHPAAKSA